MNFQDFLSSLMKDHWLAFRQIVVRRITRPQEVPGAACLVNAPRDLQTRLDSGHKNR